MRIEPQLGALVFQRDGFRCVACGFSIRSTLAVHHIIPKSLGGRDHEANLKTLCANCHRIVHWLSVGRRLEGRAAVGLKEALSPSSLRVLWLLARRI
jgi:5-methylcytosine-specific restriction endonuclease McrA